MGRGEAPRPGATARRFRFTSARITSAGLAPRRTARFRIVPALLALALSLPAGALATACGNSRTTGAPSATATQATAPLPPSPSASARQPLSPTELCTTAVRYWARRILDGATPYGDYQSMGLSNRQYGILREVVDAAQTTKRAQGTRAAKALIDRQTRIRCTQQYRDGGPTEGPWQ
ncbi:hypothetical protein [Streptomyces sp. AC602_WCS936]|uniref:hypothetical protein n=1 Tax=Streptomyces sp. AC602_WCS936 TaxID=2823685 RepID=UPI0020B7B9DD|nr:hypothetical protein [Streptomyces sp. AC602_WCS936]